jgi:hypothetical protein
MKTAAKIIVALLLCSADLAAQPVVKYYHLDGLGSVRAVTDAAGQVVERHECLYARNNTLRYLDPDGRAIETPWDALNLGIGVASFAANVAAGNLGGAVVDALGIVYDATATAVPVLPGGAGTAIRAARAGTRPSTWCGLATRRWTLPEPPIGRQMLLDKRTPSSPVPSPSSRSPRTAAGLRPRNSGG